MQIINKTTGVTLAVVFSGDDLTLEEALNLAKFKTTTRPDTGKIVYLDAFGKENSLEDLKLVTP